MLALVRAIQREVALCAALLVALVVASSLAGCGGARHGSSQAAKTSSPPSSPVATRWWSNSAVTSGSTISPAQPGAEAARLHVSPGDYCGMLKQTVAAGKSILPGITATDPALLTSTKAFVAEIEKVAPAGVTAQWQVLGPTVLALVKSGGDTAALPTGNLGAVTTAALAIAADSKKNCGVDLSTVTGLLPGGH
jgi:hypothetical protein